MVFKEEGEDLVPWWSRLWRRRALGGAVIVTLALELALPERDRILGLDRGSHNIQLKL